MPKINLYDMSANKVGTVEVSDLFTVPYNESLIHDVVVAHLANQRQGTKSALTRSEVRGHAKKPWKQKGTGRARQGSTKGPQWVGGGVVFAPKPRDFSKKVNKQAKEIAFLSALSTKIADKELFVIKDFALTDAKTKSLQTVLDNFKVSGKAVIVTKTNDATMIRASKNIQDLSVVEVELLNTYELVSNKVVLMSEDALKQLEEAFN
jgi:large subunit ribosomal protein L4